MKPHFLIAAPASGSGKTTITLGLLRLLHNKGLKVQAFKCGPDYIDTAHHAIASKRPGINLDSFMMTPAHITELFYKYGETADVSVVEGVMGLFDGAVKMKGSSAEIALLLQLPVILVVNARAMAYSAAALLFGYKNFNPAVKIKGVIFNFVKSESHYLHLKEACADVGLEAFGYLPENKEIRLPSRHLGLALTPENDYESIVEKAASHLAKTVDIDKLLNIKSEEKPQLTHVSSETKNTLYTSLKIAVARDAAFNFIYHENIEVLKKIGQTTFFSPLNDVELPEADLLYLPGGYPELFLKTLSENIAMRNAILSFCNKGGKVVAECGGMMYLGTAIIDENGQSYTMCGFLDLISTMENAKLSLGYRSVTYKEHLFKAHEFHYSTSIKNSAISQLGEVRDARENLTNTPVYHKKNVLASYMHFYWGDLECSAWLSGTSSLF